MEREVLVSADHRWEVAAYRALCKITDHFLGELRERPWWTPKHEREFRRVFNQYNHSAVIRFEKLNDKSRQKVLDTKALERRNGKREFEYEKLICRKIRSWERVLARLN